MNIRLPEGFSYAEKDRDDFAYVDDDILYVYGYINFEHLMYDLSYALHGYSRCYYCNRLLTKSNRTLDHLNPRRWGGISLPDNLVPSCKDCNQTKTDMTLRQFEKFKTLDTKNQQRGFYEKCTADNEAIIKTGKFIMPQEWITMYDATGLIEKFSFEHLDPTKMQKLGAYYNRVHQYTHPIVVSSNDWLFKGKHILCHAKKIHRHIVPAIILENVVVMESTS